MRTAIARLPIAPVILTAAGPSACAGGGPAQTVTKSIELDDAASVSLTLNITAGELRVGGGASRLIDGTFHFNVPEWQPPVR